MHRCVLTLLLILILLFSTIIIFAAFVVSQGNNVASPANSGSIWNSNLENFVSEIAFNDNKLFAVDKQGIVRCFNALDGKSVWNSSASGNLITSTLTVCQDKVFVGTLDSVVKSIDKYSGETQQKFQAPISDIGWKSAPSLTVANGAVLASSGGGTYAYDTDTGEVLWNSTIGAPLYWVYDYPQLFLPFKDGFFCVPTLSFLDAKNGNIIWDLPGVSRPPVFFEDRVILWNYEEAGNPGSGTTLLCVDASGLTLWSFDVGYLMYQPTICKDLVLFGAYDGNFYGVNLSNGDMEWKTHVTNQNGRELIESELPYYPLAPVASQARVDQQGNRVFWSFAFIQSWGGIDEYTGVACSLDITNGLVVWTNPIEKNMPISSDSAGLRFTSLGLALLDNDVFLTAGSDLWILSESTGNVAKTLHFDHYVLPPIVGENMVFVVADLWLFAYS